MKIAVVSYSLTGNNDALAGSVAEALAAEHIRINEQKSRTTGTIMLDMMLGRTPKTEPSPESLDKYDLIIFAGPVWMGQAASPLRGYLKHIKEKRRKFAFISISGGGRNPNPKLPEDLKKRAGAESVALVDQHIANLLPPGSKPTMKETSAYKVTREDIKQLTENIMGAVGQKVKNAG